MKKTTILVLIGAMFVACQNNNTEPKQKPLSQNQKNDAVFVQFRKKADKIVIQSYRITPHEVENLNHIVWTKKTTSPKGISEFNQLMDTIKNHGYCCCPKTHYTISLRNKNKELVVYNIDTIEVKDKALLFDQSYQTSYYIPLKKWNTFIKAL